jgi:hypothetical protein
MNKVVPYEFVLNKQDRFHFLLFSLKLPISRDIRQYIARYCFFDQVFPPDEVFYKEMGISWSGDIISAYENIKYQNKTNQTTTDICGICGIALAYAKCGYKVIIFDSFDKKSRFEKMQFISEISLSSFDIITHNNEVIKYANGGKIYVKPITVMTLKWYENDFDLYIFTAPITLPVPEHLKNVLIARMEK